MTDKTTSKALPVYLSLEEAAQVMSLSVRTIRRRIADGTMGLTPESWTRDVFDYAASGRVAASWFS